MHTNLPLFHVLSLQMTSWLSRASWMDWTYHLAQKPVITLIVYLSLAQLCLFTSQWACSPFTILLMIHYPQHTLTARKKIHSHLAVWIQFRFTEMQSASEKIDYLVSDNIGSGNHHHCRPMRREKSYLSLAGTSVRAAHSVTIMQFA